MKFIIFLLPVMINSVSAKPFTHNQYFEKPLFNYAIDKNRLPQGNYCVVRSHNKVTQILISSQWQVRTLYIDRENNKDSTIYISSMALYKEVFIDKQSIPQSLFNNKVKLAVLYGNSEKLTTHPFYGIKDLFNLVKNGKGKIKRSGSIFTIWVKTQKNRNLPVFIMDSVCKSLVINYYFSEKGVIVPPVDALKDEYFVKPVVIVETKDPLLIDIIKNYASKFFDYLGK